ncbi:MAG: hypothetical protein ACI3Y0_01990 [Prevotella sp.]
MRKNLLLMIATMFSVVVFGQVNREQFLGGKVENVKFLQHSSVCTRSVENDELPWAYYLSEYAYGYSIGRNATGEYSAAMFVPGDGILQGAKISSLGIPSVIDGMKDVKVWVRESVDGKDLATGSVSSIDKYSFGKAQLNKECDIPEKGLYVGYTFNSSKTYPILFSGTDNPNACWIKCPNSEWEDLYGYEYGSVSIQVYVTGKEFPKNNLFIELEKPSIIAKAGGEAEIMRTITSYSSNEITSYTMLVDNGESKSYYKVDCSEYPFKPGLGSKKNICFTFDAPNAISANNKVTFTIVEVNDETNTNTEAVAELIVKTAQEGGTRRTLVEEYTGTACGYCPIGMASMEAMKKLYGEKFIGIALHQFNYNDPMYLELDKYYPLGFSGAPSSMIDRATYIYPTNLNDNFEKYNSIPPLADVNVNAWWNEDGTAVEAYTDIESLTNDLNLKVAYVLVADGLTKNSAKWAQSNYYSGENSSQWKDDWIYEEFKEFCSGGKYGTDAVVGLVFNDVAISTSYINYETEVPAYEGISLGEVISNHYTQKYTASSELKSVVDREKVSIVVILEDEDGNVINAAEAPVQAYSTGIHNNASENAVVERVFSIDGRETTKLGKGINIVKMSDGSVKKVLGR